MAITRKQALKRIEGLAGDGASGIEGHLTKLARRGAGPHIRAELNARLGEIERLIPHIGKKSGEQWAEKVARWRLMIAEANDVDY